MPPLQVPGKKIGRARLRRLPGLCALASDADSKEHRRPRVTLMTLHASKGWSFPVVCPRGHGAGVSSPATRSWGPSRPRRRSGASAYWV